MVYQHLFLFQRLNVSNISWVILCNFIALAHSSSSRSCRSSSGQPDRCRCHCCCPAAAAAAAHVVVVGQWVDLEGLDSDFEGRLVPGLELDLPLCCSAAGSAGGRSAASSSPAGVQFSRHFSSESGQEPVPSHVWSFETCPNL